jgi:predicted PurR-regulated permease PerM
MALTGPQTAVLWTLVGLLVLLLYLIIQPFLVPLAWAVILVVFLFPLHRWLLKRICRPTLTALASVLAVTIVLIAPVSLLVPAFIGETVSFAGNLTTAEFFEKASAWLDSYARTLSLEIPSTSELIRTWGQELIGIAAKQSARIAGNVATTLFDLVVMLLAMFYLFRDGPALVDFLEEVSPLSSERQRRILGEVTEMIRVTMTSSFVVAAVQGGSGALVYWVLGLPSPVFWGALMALLSLLPVLGAWLVWGPMAIVLLFSGQTGKGIALLVLGILLVSGVDNVLRPALIAGRAQMNGLLIFISLLGGVAAFGFLGIILGPVLVATFVGLMKGYRESVSVI